MENDSAALHRLLTWLDLKERSQPTKSSFCETLFENIFRHYCPRQFKVQITTGSFINNNKLARLNYILKIKIEIVIQAHIFAITLLKNSHLVE